MIDKIKKFLVNVVLVLKLAWILARLMAGLIWIIIIEVYDTWRRKRHER